MGLKVPDDDASGQGHGLIHPFGPTSTAPDAADQFVLESDSGLFWSRVLVDHLDWWQYAGILLKAGGLVAWLPNQRDAEPTVVACAEASVSSAQQLRDEGVEDESNPYELLSEKLHDEILSCSQDESLASALAAFKAALSESELEVLAASFAQLANDSALATSGSEGDVSCANYSAMIA